MDFRLEIEKLFDNGSIGVVGVPHPNGADELQCLKPLMMAIGSPSASASGA